MKVDNAPIREAFEKSGLSSSDLARAVGWYTRKGAPDVTRIQRTLGILKGQTYRVSKKTGEKKKFIYTQTHMSYENALLFANALRLDPVEVGL